MAKVLVRNTCYSSTGSIETVLCATTNIGINANLYDLHWLEIVGRQILPSLVFKHPFKSHQTPTTTDYASTFIILLSKQQSKVIGCRAVL